MPAQHQRADEQVDGRVESDHGLGGLGAHPRRKLPHVPSDRRFASRRPSPTRSSPRAVSPISSAVSSSLSPSASAGTAQRLAAAVRRAAPHGASPPPAPPPAAAPPPARRRRPAPMTRDRVDVLRAAAGRPPRRPRPPARAAASARRGTRARPRRAARAPTSLGRQRRQARRRVVAVNRLDEHDRAPWGPASAAPSVALSARASSRLVSGELSDNSSTRPPTEHATAPRATPTSACASPREQS